MFTTFLLSTQRLSDVLLRLYVDETFKERSHITKFSLIFQRKNFGPLFSPQWATDQFALKLFPLMQNNGPK